MWFLVTTVLIENLAAVLSLGSGGSAAAHRNVSIGGREGRVVKRGSRLSKTAGRMAGVFAYGDEGSDPSSPFRTIMPPCSTATRRFSRPSASVFKVIGLGSAPRYRSNIVIEYEPTWAGPR